MDVVGVERFKLRLTQGGERQGLTIQQLGVVRRLFGENERAEGDREGGFGLQPSVGENTQEVLGRHGVQQGYGEVHVLRLIGVATLQHPVLVVKNLLSVAVLHQQVEALRGAVNGGIVLKVGRQGKFYGQHRTGDG